MNDPTPPLPEPPPPPAHVHPRAVPWRHAIAWYADAMRLFKHAPVSWAALAFVALVVEFALEAVPGVGSVLGKLLTPLVACGLIYAAAAADGRAPLSLAFALRAFGAPVGAIAAIVGASLVTLAAEAFAAWWIADANLLAPAASAALAPTAIAGVYAIGVLASLPVTFVPFHVLLEGVDAGTAFRASWNAFVLNTTPLLVYAAASLALLGLGFATMGAGLLIVLPLWAASSYAAWKDIFGVRDAP
jgi:uncharacterized membrane protein